MIYEKELLFHIRIEDQTNQTQELTSEEPLRLRIFSLVF